VSTQFWVQVSTVVHMEKQGVPRTPLSQRSLLQRSAVLHAVPISIINVAMLYFIFVKGAFLKQQILRMLNLSA